MFKFYKKERIKELKIEIETNYKSIPYSSLLISTEYSDFEESFFTRLGNEKWNCIASEMFTACIINLLISRKIDVVYFEDKKSILHNLINFKASGYYIYPVEIETKVEDDLLACNIMSNLQQTSSNRKGNLPIILKKVINLYNGTGETNVPGKKFIYEYLINYSKKHLWLKLRPNNKFLGLIKNYNFEINIDKQNELKNSNNELNILKFQLRKTNLLFRDFLNYLDQIVKKDLVARRPSG